MGIHPIIKCDCCCTEGIREQLEGLTNQLIEIAYRTQPTVALTLIVESVNEDVVILRDPDTEQLKFLIPLCEILAIAFASQDTTTSAAPDLINNQKSLLL